MRRSVFCRHVSCILSAIVVGLTAPLAHAANGVWYSTNGVSRNTYWTNSWNWTARPFPAGNETATFNNSVNITNTTIDLTGLTYGCSNIVFDTANVAAYTLGSNGVNQQTLVFTNNSGVRLSTTVANPQRINALVQLGHDRTASTHMFRNEQPVAPLILAGNVTAPAVGGTGAGKTMNLGGIGDITIFGNILTNGYSPLTLTDATFGNVLLTGVNMINTLNANAGPLTLSGTNRIVTFNLTSGNAILAGSNLVDTITLTGGALNLVGTNRVTTFNHNANAPVNLSGTNIVTTWTFNGTGGAVVNVLSGTLSLSNLGTTTFVANQDAVINGPGSIFLSYTATDNWADNSAANGKTLTINAKLTGDTGFEYYGAGAGTIVLNGTNDFIKNVYINNPGTISVRLIGNKGVAGNLGKGTMFRFSADGAGARLLYTGEGEATDRTLDFQKTVSIIEQAGTGNLKFTAPITVNAGNKNIILQGSTSGTGEFSGLLWNNGGVVSITKAGTGTWTLSTNNTYTGATTVNAGTLSLAGTHGAVAATASIALAANATLVLNNTSAANNTNRLNDAAALSLAGATLSFSNTGGSVNYSENAGAVTLNPGASTIATVQAASGQTATLRFASLTRNVGGSVNFTGAGLGADTRNRIFITTGQAEGLIGPWATVNGTNLAAYSAANGVYAADDAAVFTDIAAYGDTIVSNDASYVRVNTFGTSGPITLGSDVTRVTALAQNTAYAATVDTAGKALQTAGISVPADKASVTVGAAANDGTLSPLLPNGELVLDSGVANGLTVNATLADSGAASKLTKTGSGSVTLAGSNTFSGTVTAAGGALALANTFALQSATLTTTGTVFDSSVDSHAFVLGNLSGAFGLSLADNAGTPNPVALTVGKNNADALFAGVLSGAGSLTKGGNATLTLSGANIFTGGLAIDLGTVIASNAYALGIGGLANNGTVNLPLTGNAYYYSGISNSMSGAGTVNVWLPSGASTTFLNGDYAGFTGVWNIGTNAAAGWGKVQMNGPDNAAATLNILPHSAAMIAGGTHYATAVLNGGDTGESIGQLRVEANANWAGPVTLAGAITATADGHIGANSGQGTISGAIGESGGTYGLTKVGAGTNYLTGLSTYVGPTWIKNGGLRVDTLGSVDGGDSPLGNPTSIAEGTVKLCTVNTNGTLLYTGNGETSDRQIEMGGTLNSVATLWHGGSNTLTLTGDVISTLDINKQLRLHGTTVGATGVLAGVFSDYGAASTNNLLKAGPGIWTLAGNNTFKGNVQVENGGLCAASSGAFGDWPKSVTVANNQNGSNPHLHFDGALGNLTFPTSITFRTSSVRAGAIHNDGGTNTVRGPLYLTGGDGDTHLYANSGKVIFEGFVKADVYARGLHLRGDADGEISGNIIEGPTTNMPVYRDGGSGTWTLLGFNTYSGLTYVSSGTLAVGGAAGYINGNLSISSSGTFALRNTALENSADRLGDTNNVVLGGGFFAYSHTGGAANYSETAGPLLVTSGTNAVVASQADESQSSILTFASLTRSGNATLNFQGEGLGVDDRNKILFTTSPGTGIIGLWATHNGTNVAAYSDTLGVTAAGDALFTDLTAKGPALIPDDAALNARINSEGTEGVIGLAGATTSSIKSLLHNTDWDSTVGMTNQTLLVNDLMIATGGRDLTLGTAENEGLVMPLTSGGTLALINPSTNTLTINAGVTNNGATGTKLVKSGTGAVKLNGRSSYTGTTQIYEGSLEFGGSSTQTLSGVISGAGELVKTGSGRLTLSAGNTYMGTTTIKQGSLVAQNNAALGNALAGTVIEDGGTLDLGGTLGANALNLGAEVVTVSGAGVNGRGAIINSSKNTQQNALRFVTLAGDTTFGGEETNGRWDMRNTVNPATLIMNDFDITKVGSNYVILVSVGVMPGSGNIDVKEGIFSTEASTLMNGSSANLMTVRSGATYDIWNLVTPISWSMLMEDNAKFYSRSGNVTNQNIWAGPVSISGRAVFDGVNASTDTLAGDITGAGSVIKIGAGVTTYFTSPNNTYDGTTVISNGALVAKYAGSLPGYDSGKVTVVGGATLSLIAGDGTTGWSAVQLQALHDSSIFANNTAILAVDTTQNSIDNTANLTKTLALTKNGNNTLTLNGTNTFSGALTVNAGTLSFASDTTNFTGNITVNNAAVLAFNGPAYNTNGTVTINNFGVQTYGSGTTNDVGGATVNAFGVLNFAAGSTSTVAGVTAKGSSTVSVNGALSLRNYNMTVGNAVGDRPTVTFNDNAYLNKLYLGNGLSSAGAVIQNGGAVTVNPAQGGQDVLSLGLSGGYGYYRMNGGTLTVGQFALTGNGAGQNTAVFDQFGGDVRVTSTSGWLIWGWQTGYGVYNLFGGTVANPPSASNPPTMAFVANRNCFGMLNLLGPSAQFNSTVSAHNLQLAAQPGNMGSVVNLNGGSLLANRVIANSAATPTFLNFGGGTLRANTAQAQFLQGMSYATVYPGGAVIDATNVAVTVNQTLQAPTGHGVTGATILSGGQGYCGAPVVQITGGSGTGATAIATVDLAEGSPTRGKVTGLTVTSPGFGYGASDILTVRLLGGGFTNNLMATASLSLSPNSAAGGLTKLGTGVLTLGGTNTYGGTTTISAGTLKLAHAFALPTGTAVDVSAGATLDLNGLTATNTFSGSGTVSNGTVFTVLSPAGEGVVGAQTLTLKSVTVTGTYLADVTALGASDVVAVQGNINLSGIALQIVDTDALDRHQQYTLLTCTGTRTGTFSSENVADARWKLIYLSDGTVKLIFVDGTLIKVR